MSLESEILEQAEDRLLDHYYVALKNALGGGDAAAARLVSLCISSNTPNPTTNMHLSATIYDQDKLTF